MLLKSRKHKIIISCFLISLVLLLFYFGMHCMMVDRYNKTVRTVAFEEESDTAEIRLHPRGQKTDSWEKDDVLEGAKLYGQIYEVNVVNKSGYDMDSWSIRINIDRDCFINNAWNGTIDIHRMLDGGEKSQVINLLNYNEEEIILPHSVVTSTLFIPLAAGDYIEYLPNLDMGEAPLASTSKTNGEIAIGIILYNYSEDEMYYDYSLTYTLHKGYFSGPESVIFLILMPVWLFLAVVYGLYLILAHRYEVRIREKESIIDESIEVFSSFVDAKDPYTQGHSERVADYSYLIAEKLGYKTKDLKNIYYIARLHDIGKCYVPDAILKKAGRLDAAEFEEVKKHTTFGYKMLSHFSSVKAIADGAHYHHERYDGKGYPDGLKGEKIPEIARIICLADSFDAMNSNRCYREHLSKEEILKEINDNKGTQFDPYIADKFLEVLKEKEYLFADEG